MVIRQSLPDDLVVLTKSLNVFVGVSSAGVSDSAVAGSGEAELSESDSAGGAGFLDFFARLKGTSPSTFLLLTEDIIAIWNVEFEAGEGREGGGEKINSYRDLASDWLRKS